MPICAPVGGSPSAAISGHTPPACSEVIRYTASGAGTGAPARRPAGAAAAADQHGERVAVLRPAPAAGSAAAGGGRSRRPAAPRPAAAPAARPVAADHQRARRRGRPIAERDAGRGEAGVLGQVQPQRREPAAADAGLQPAAVVGDRPRVRHGDRRGDARRGPARCRRRAGRPGCSTRAASRRWRRADLEPAAASELGGQLGASSTRCRPGRSAFGRVDGLEEHRGAAPLPGRRSG